MKAVFSQIFHGNWIVSSRMILGGTVYNIVHVKTFYCAIHRSFLWISMDLLRFLVYLESRGD